MEEDGSPIVDGLEALAAPVRDRVFVDAEQAGGLLNRVGIMNFDKARAEALSTHWYPVIDGLFLRHILLVAKPGTEGRSNKTPASRRLNLG